MSLPPTPLFAGETVLGSWRAHYLYRSPAFRPASWWVGARNLMSGGRQDAIAGELHLTTRRLVFGVSQSWLHPLAGHFSLFLERLCWVGWRPEGVLVVHRGSSDPARWEHLFAVRSGGSLLEALKAQYQASFQHPTVIRELFLEQVHETWWRAGLGLRPSGQEQGTPWSLNEADSYRSAGNQPSFEQLSEQRTGLEGEGLAQLRWLMLPTEAIPEKPPRDLGPEGFRLSEGAILPPDAPALGVRRGRPLEVGDEPRQSGLSKGKRGW